MSRTAEPVSDHLARATVLRRLELAVRRRLDGRAAGDHHSTSPGPGSERAGARDYQPGDDARRIDWNLTARSLATQVRQTEADRELETWLVVDRSASLDFGTALREKRDAALGVTAAVGVLTVRAGNRLGAVQCGGPQLAIRPAKAGRRHMLAILADIYDTPRHDSSPPASADLTAGLRRQRQIQPRRSQVVVVSDFLDGTDWARALRETVLHNQVIAVHVTDPREHELPDVGLLRTVDPETGRLLTVQTGSASLRARYAEAATARLERIRRDIRASGAEYLWTSTDRDWLSDVIRFTVGRRQIQRTLA